MAAVREAGLASRDIDAVIGGSYASGTLTAQRAIRGLGLAGRPVLNVENACASSAAAAALAATLVRSGVYRNVLVLGIEQLSRTGSSLVPLNPDDPEVRLGLIMPAAYAMRARRYAYEFGTTAAQLAAVSVNVKRSPVTGFSSVWPGMSIGISCRSGCRVGHFTPLRRDGP